MLRYYMYHGDPTKDKFYFRYSGNESSKLSSKEFLKDITPKDITPKDRNNEELKSFYEIITGNNVTKEKKKKDYINVLQELINDECLLKEYTNQASHISIYDKCNCYITNNKNDNCTIENLKYLLILECLKKITEKILYNNKSTHGKTRADNLCLYIKTKDETEYRITEFTDGNNRGKFKFKSKGKNDTEWKIEEECLRFEEVIDKTRNIEKIEEAGIKEKEKEK